MSAAPFAAAGLPRRAWTPYFGLMRRDDLAERIHDGENSVVAFQRDDLAPEALASVLVGFLNRKGGSVLLGVEDDGAVSGLHRERREAEEWALACVRRRVRPAVIPMWQTIRWDERRTVGIVSVRPEARDRPYQVRQLSAWVTRVRAGTKTWDASLEEERRLYLQSALPFGSPDYGRKPALGSDLGALDRRRLRDYFCRVQKREAPAPDDDAAWAALLVNLGLATASWGHLYATVAGVLLFGREPKRLLPQSGIRARCFPGREMDSAPEHDLVLAGPLVALSGEDGSIREPGLVERGLDFVRHHAGSSARFGGGRRAARREYPEAVVRETLVNGLVHRDYRNPGTDRPLDLLLFSDRLEVCSPGSLPGTVTTEGVRCGQRYSRDQMLVDVMRDYGYTVPRGRGVRNRIIAGMRAHNGTEPDLIEEDHRFTVRLWKDATAA